jgi:hypothetical protein
MTRERLLVLVAGRLLEEAALGIAPRSSNHACVLAWQAGYVGQIGNEIDAPRRLLQERTHSLGGLPQETQVQRLVESILQRVSRSRPVPAKGARPFPHSRSKS